MSLLHHGCFMTSLEKCSFYIEKTLVNYTSCFGIIEGQWPYQVAYTRAWSISIIHCFFLMHHQDSIKLDLLQTWLHTQIDATRNLQGMYVQIHHFDFISGFLIYNFLVWGAWSHQHKWMDPTILKRAKWAHSLYLGCFNELALSWVFYDHPSKCNFCIERNLILHTNFFVIIEGQILP
jgi:putative flippase GtrA